MTLTVSNLAEQVGLTADTLRYYERVGLVPPPERSAAGYRLYEESTARRLRFIKGAQWVGLRLREIGDLLRAMDEGDCPCPETESLLRQRMAETDAEMARLGELRAELSRLVGQFPSQACQETSNTEWWCERELTERG